MSIILWKKFLKTNKTIKDQGRKQAEPLQSLNPKQQLKQLEDIF